MGTDGDFYLVFLEVELFSGREWRIFRKANPLGLQK